MPSTDSRPRQLELILGGRGKKEANGTPGDPRPASKRLQNRCVRCGEPLVWPTWPVEPQGSAHEACISWDQRSFPYAGYLDRIRGLELAASRRGKAGVVRAYVRSFEALVDRWADSPDRRELLVAARFILHQLRAQAESLGYPDLLPRSNHAPVAA